MKKVYFILFLFIVVIVGCKKTIDHGHIEFIGDWQCNYSPDFTVLLTIDGLSDAKYSEVGYGGSVTSRSGKARANENKLKIGNTFHFKVIEYPHKLDTSVVKYQYYQYSSGSFKTATWKMILSGLIPKIYLDGPLTFYKAD